MSTLTCHSERRGKNLGAQRVRSFASLRMTKPTQDDKRVYFLPKTNSHSNLADQPFSKITKQ
ncbi:MAG: hypothetical protein ACXVDN_24820, partial [Ktedonobacteraceae bacterium]